MHLLFHSDICTQPIHAQTHGRLWIPSESVTALIYQTVYESYSYTTISGSCPCFMDRHFRRRRTALTTQRGLDNKGSAQLEQLERHHSNWGVFSQNIARSKWHPTMVWIYQIIYTPCFDFPWPSGISWTTIVIINLVQISKPEISKPEIVYLGWTAAGCWPEEFCGGLLIEITVKLNQSGDGNSLRPVNSAALTGHVD